MRENTQDLHTDTVRQALAAFWGESLEVAATGSGVALAVPLCFPDGWQVAFEIQSFTPKTVRVTDGGRTLQWLAGTGQSIETEHVAGLLNERLKLFHIHRDGRELYRELPLPLEGVDLHLFGEALVSIAYLNYLHEPASRGPNVARQTVETIFRDRNLQPLVRHPLDGKLERGIRVDYYVDAVHPVAMEVIGRRGSITGYMEQWGFRWRDLRDAHPRLMPVMIYDPAVSEVDEVATAIGESVCEVFCAYDETKRIHDLLEMAQNP